MSKEAEKIFKKAKSENEKRAQEIQANTDRIGELQRQLTQLKTDYNLDDLDGFREYKRKLGDIESAIEFLTEKNKSAVSHSSVYPADWKTLTEEYEKMKTAKLKELKKLCGQILDLFDESKKEVALMAGAAYEVQQMTGTDKPLPEFWSLNHVNLYGWYANECRKIVEKETL